MFFAHSQFPPPQWNVGDGGCEGGESSCQREPSSAAEIGGKNGCDGGRGAVMRLCS